MSSKTEDICSDAEVFRRIKCTAKKVLDFDSFHSLWSFRLRGGNVIVNVKHCACYSSYSRQVCLVQGSQVCITRSSVIKSLIAFTSPLLSLSLLSALCFCISLSYSYTVRAAVKAERKSLKASSSDVEALSIVAAGTDDRWCFVNVQETPINDK